MKYKCIDTKGFFLFFTNFLKKNWTLISRYFNFIQKILFNNPTGTPTISFWCTRDGGGCARPPLHQQNFIMQNPHHASVETVWSKSSSLQSRAQGSSCVCGDCQIKWWKQKESETCINLCGVTLAPSRNNPRTQP
jgi:hypothetical protein